MSTSAKPQPPVAERKVLLLRASDGVLLDVFPDLGDDDGALTHRRGHTLYRPRPHIADSKNAGAGSRKR